MSLVSTKQLKLDVLRQSWHDRQTYTYRVRATNAGGPSAYSNEATATTASIRGSNDAA